MPFDLRLRTPFNMFINGPSQSGKTTFLRTLLSEAPDLFMENPEHVVLFYAIHQPLYDQMMYEGLIHEMFDIAKVQLNFQNVKDKMSIYGKGSGSVIIFDDIMSFMKDIPNFDSFFTVLGHHIKCSFIFIGQNFFPKGHIFRTISLNFKILVVFRNPRDESQIRPISMQVCPGDVPLVQFAHQEATKNPFGYTFIDCTNNMEDFLRLRTNIFIDENDMFPDNPCTIFYKDERISIL